MEAVKGSQLDSCGYPLNDLPREPPGVRVALQLHHKRLCQHSPAHPSAVVGDPWRPDSHLPTPAPPPPSSTERPFGCGALWAPSSTRAVAPQPVQPTPLAPRVGKHSLRHGAPPPARGAPSAVGSRTQPAWQHHLCPRQSRSADRTTVVPRTTAFPCQQAVVEWLGSMSFCRGGCEPWPRSPPVGSKSGSPASPPGPGGPGTQFPAPCAPTPNNNGASRCATAPPPHRHTRAHTHVHGRPPP